MTFKYTKKPVEIEAFQVCTPLDYSNGTVPEWFYDAINKGIAGDLGNCVEIITLEGVMIANPGDYIIKGIKGELYPCKEDIFLATYTPNN